MFRGFFITVTLLGILLTETNGQTVFHSVEEMWKYADVHSSSIRNAKFEMDKYTFARKQSFMAFLPTVNANASFTDNLALQTTLIPSVIFDKSAPAGKVTPVQFGQKYIYVAGVTAQMDIINLQTWYNVQVAKNSEELNKASLSNARKTVYQQIASQYYSCLLMVEAAKLSERSRQISDSVYQSVAAKFAEGTVNESGVDLAKINLERAEQALLTARYQALTAKNNLKNLLDLSVSDSLSIDAMLKDNMSLDERTPFTEDPAIRQALYNSKVSLGMFRAGNSNFAPVISVAYSNTTQQNDNKYEPFQGGPAWYPSRFWSLRATWGIFTAGTRWLQSERNKVAWFESKLQYETVQKQSAINDDNLRLSYQKSQAILARSSNVMNLSLDNYTHISYRYADGLATLDERLNAYSDYINYQNQYLNNLADFLAQVCQVKIRQQNF